MLSNKKLNPVVAELFVRGRKLNNSLAFIRHPYFGVPRNIRLHSTHYCIMKIPNKRDLQQIAFNHSSDIDFKYLINVSKICTAKPYSLNHIHEKLQYDINREAAKVSTLSSGKIDKYEYLTGEEKLPSEQRRVVEQTKFTFSP